MLKYLPYTISKLKELQALWLAENQVNINSLNAAFIMSYSLKFYFIDQAVNTFTARKRQINRQTVSNLFLVPARAHQQVYGQKSVFNQ
jgi:hypothetical protein